MRGRGVVAKWVCVGSLFAVIAGTSPRADACTIAGLVNATINPALRETDQQAPALPPPGLVAVKRGRGPQQSGCGETASSCDDLGTVQLAVAATDDQTPPARIGYRIRSAGGAAPAGLPIPEQPVEAVAGMLYLVWIDAATDDQEAIDVSLELTAIDGAGNESPPQTVRIQHGGSSGGCGLVADRAGGTLSSLVAAALVALAARRRRGAF